MKAAGEQPQYTQSELNKAVTDASLKRDFETGQKIFAGTGGFKKDEIGGFVLMVPYRVSNKELNQLPSRISENFVSAELGAGTFVSAGGGNVFAFKKRCVAAAAALTQKLGEMGVDEATKEKVFGVLDAAKTTAETVVPNSFGQKMRRNVQRASTAARSPDQTMVTSLEETPQKKPHSPAPATPVKDSGTQTGPRQDTVVTPQTGKKLESIFGGSPTEVSLPPKILSGGVGLRGLRAKTARTPNKSQQL